MQITVTLLDGGTEHDIVLDHDPDADPAASLRAVCVAAGMPAHTRLFRSGGPHGGVGSGLRHGEVLTTTPEPPRGPRLAVVGGHAAGRAVALSRPVCIGRDEGADLALADPEVSRRHALAHLVDMRVDVTDLGSANGTHTVVAAPADPVFRTGSTLLALPPRPPSVAAADPGPAVVVPDPPSPPPRTGWLALALPALAAAAIGAWLRQPALAMFAIAGSVAGFAQRLGGDLRYLRQRRAYRRARRAAQRIAAERSAAEAELAADRAWRAHPDPASWLPPIPAARGVPVAVEQRIRLGVSHPPEEHLADPPAADRSRHTAIDTIAGSTAVPAAAELSATSTAASPDRHGTAVVPLTVPRPGPAGIVVRGPAGPAEALAAWIALQVLAAGPSPDGGMAAPAGTAWRWRRWLAPTQPAPPAAPMGEHRLAVEVGDGPDGPCVRLRLGGEGSDTDGPPDVVVDLDPYQPARMTVVDGHRGDLRTGIADLVPADVIDRLARRVGAVRTPARDVAEWTDLVGVDLVADPETDAAAVRRRWAAADGRLSACLGTGTHDGRAVVVDLTEHGPHLLVVGATGSGKSVLLQTLVLGLAVTAPPEDLAFVLVDYKGGATFEPLRDLPHVLAVTTDLTPAGSRRIVQSLAAELRRRERLLADHGFPDVASWRAAATGAPVPSPPGIPPRLIVLIDEFGQLAEEEPGLIDRLVTVARRGRSLGVHLVLATQRPGVAVTADVRANTALRICLPVTSAGESQDVIGDTAASAPGRPGQAWIRMAGGLVGCRVSRLDQPLPGRRPRAWPMGRPPAATGPTIAATAVAAAVRAGAGRRAQPHTPWLPPLPATVALAELDPATRNADPDGRTTRLQVPLGIADIPDRQLQPALSVDLGAQRHLVVAGGPGSGRTTCLQTVADQLGRCADPPPLYAVHARPDWPQLDRLGHVGGVASPSDADLLRRLLAFLRLPAPTRPVLLVDDWDALADAQADGTSVHEHLLALAAAPSGPHLVVAAGRAGVAGRLAAISPMRLLLGRLHPDDYGALGLTRGAPSSDAPGRAVTVPGGQDVQIATSAGVAGAPPQPVAPAAAVRIRPMPWPVPLAAISSPAPAGPTAVVLGVGGLLPTPLVVDVGHRPPGFLVAGPRRSGRTTCLSVIAGGLVGNGVPVLATAGGPPASDHPLASTGARYLPNDRPHEVRDALADTMVVLVDDVDRCVPAAVEDHLLQWLAGGGQRRVVLAGMPETLGRSFVGLVPEVRRSGSGVLLQPRSPVAGDLLDVRLPRRDWSDLPSGRGLLVCDGVLADLQVALPC